eukprot:TRINITY_DN11132_c0_g1_i1.p1 TRINITY_DN11132_c0_g1~~TRINITY_DN11132_c0_g1_i1.p1  ORF type:complete len:929 (+),score=222.04 TRINITY_DN11132_c0_g1_i1:38-2824(+)
MAYTAEEVDEKIIQLENKMERHLATLTSAVKRVAAERDLLSTAEAARDLLLRAVKGEKEWLDKVFGGSCERIGRLRLLLDRVRFSDMHVSDQRWQNLRDCIETIEAVLKDLGTFKPWVPTSCKAPERLTYKVRRRLSPGRRVNLRPELEGCEAATFAVSPDLPAALELETSTGLISGTLQLGVLLEEATYVVTARNDAGEVSTELAFAVKDPPPVGLTYPLACAELTVGEAVSWTADLTSGTASEWSVTPDLPDGMVLSASSGSISGAPKEVSAERSFEVTASNSGGKVSTSLSFLVKVGAPTPPQYSVPDGVPLHVGEDVELKPEVAVPDASFSISPDLPDGLTIDEATGVIRGRPTSTAALAEFKVTVTNSSGSASGTVAIAVRPEKPSNLRYPQLQTSYSLGEAVKAIPEVQGAVLRFSVAPALPEGLHLDTTTGEIAGTPSVSMKCSSYVVTASGEEGETSVELSLAVVLPAPSSFSFPLASSNYAVGELVSIEPQLDGSEGCTYSIEPPLPEGLNLDPSSGVISGTPACESEETTYTVQASNASGSTSTKLVFQVSKIDNDFADKIEAIENLEDMVDEPSKAKSFGDWMIWMVHRAYLDDPSLTDFNFNNLHMPPPHVEERIAPKLMKALATNTHIETLSLVNSNLHKAQGPQLADALRANKHLVHLMVETNLLDSECLRALVLALKDNRESKLETLRVDPQKGQTYFGRPVEEAFGQLMETNETIVKLGFECHDAHWRNSIDRALLRNNDFARRRRKRATGEDEDEVQAEEKTIRRLTLRIPPSRSVSEIFKEDSTSQKTVRSFVVRDRKLPTTSQLQAFAKANGTPLKYSEVAPLLRDFRTMILDAAAGTEVIVVDAFEVDAAGTMKKWSINGNDNWSLDIWTADGKRYDYRSESGKEPSLSVSEEWAAWLDSSSGGYPAS